MINDEIQLKVQAFLDGELPEKEARDIAALLARDADAKALHNELRNTRQALAGFEPAVKLPESREFYWSKIAREIERSAPEAKPVERGAPWIRFRRFLIPAGAVAACILVAVIAGMQFGLRGTPSGASDQMTMADSGAFTYHDYDNGTTLVWMSYPAER
jgi:negative regulator of sigma E activity